MATFFKTSRLWVVHYTWRGRPRRWFKALPEGADGPALLAAELMDVQGPLARVVEIRPALPQEETDYLRGNLPKNILCPTGRRGNP
ncbi:hypothetical protein [Variovorax sp. RA8]|uniref:hypothetical protein n=1 Tax=Variovorax sp. (strain JCM 16519 / RA8) TaxID=662548 RepID=UPI0013180933|nr:hypothetical protein [Variovorax sp. RA8]VTU36463.1 hypothetical protein RA8CHR_05481 [Variovorax sp. RA8]